MNRKYIKIAVSSIVGIMLLGGMAYAVYALTHGKEKEDDTTSTVVREQTVVEVDTVVLRK